MILRAIVGVRTQRAMEHLHVRHNSDFLSRDIWVHMLIRFMSGRAKNTSHSTKKHHMDVQKTCVRTADSTTRVARLLRGRTTQVRIQKNDIRRECLRKWRTEQVIILAYVDDLMAFGETTHIQWVLQRLQQVRLIRETGHLTEEGSIIRFLGSNMQKCQDQEWQHGE